MYFIESVFHKIKKDPFELFAIDLLLSIGESMKCQVAAIYTFSLTNKQKFTDKRTKLFLETH